MRVVVLTTSYPRSGAEHAGRFVADAVGRLRAAGLEVDVVAPGRFRDFGLAHGGASDVRVIPNGVALPPSVAPPAEPPRASGWRGSARGRGVTAETLAVYREALARGE